MTLDPAVVLAAARAWVYVPPEAQQVRTSDFRVIAYPTTWSQPTVAAGIGSTRAPAEVVDQVLAAAAGLGRDAVAFWVHPDTRPDGLVEELLARGARLTEQLDVLARPLAGPPDLDPPTAVEVRPVLDLEAMREHDRVGVLVFGGRECDDEQLAAQVARADPATGLSFNAYRDGVAVGAAGLTVEDGVARLWGGAELPGARGTGVYRALLAHRLQVAADRGCELALVKGRVETSAPILRRAGFAPYGEEREYLLAPT